MTSWVAVARLGVLRSLLTSNSRQYSRNMARKPLRVLSKEEAAEGEGSSLGRLRPVVESQTPPPPTTVLEQQQDELQEEGEAILEGKLSRLPPGFPPYVTKGKDDIDLCRFALESSNKKKRERPKLIMVEGTRLIQEAFDANVIPKALFFSRVEDVTSLKLPPKSFAFQKVAYEKLKRWSKLTTSPGILGFFERPNLSLQKGSAALPLSIICDNIRDPGNLGNILRTAASAGCRKIFLTKGCVDVWNDKVVRSAMGTHFKMCILDNMEVKDIEPHLEPNAFIAFADSKDEDLASSEEVTEDDRLSEADLMNSENVHTQERTTGTSKKHSLETLPVFPYYLVDYSRMQSVYLVIGGETGFTASTINLGESFKKFRVNIPMVNDVESLGVSAATAILTHEVKRQYDTISRGRNLPTDLDSVTVLAN